MKLHRDEHILRDLRAWHPSQCAQQALRDEFVDFVSGSQGIAMDRARSRSHLTASCFVFSPDLRNILLCFHKKGRFWVQFGGHIEADDETVAAAALREAIEESGIQQVELLSVLPLDVDRHSLGTGFVSCDFHWDIGFAATADFDAVPTTSDESDDVRWWSVDLLPAEIPDGFARRLDQMIRAASELRGL